LFATPETPEAEYSDVLDLDLASVEPSIAGPKRPQDRVTLSHAAQSLEQALNHGSVVIAAITSCTNTSNPYVLVAAGLLAKKAVEKGLTVPAWVKTSLAPGS